MKSLGVIETQGFVAAIHAVDAACKAAGVTCISYRKVGSGRVSVCFEGEISAIHTAIERGVSVIGADRYVQSLVIARPENSVVEALGALKGRSVKTPSANAPIPAITPAPENQPDSSLPPLLSQHASPASVASDVQEEKVSTKKGKKA